MHPPVQQVVAAPPSLGPEHTAAILAARGRAAKIRRAAGVAAFSGWTMAVFAAVTILTGILSPVSLLLGAGLGVVAWVELRGSRQIKQLDASAGRMLAFNQLALAGMLCIYGGYGIWKALYGPGAYDDAMAAGGATAEMLEPFDELTRMVMLAFYGALIVGSLIAQGCAAWYYATRRGHIEKFLRETPDWVAQTLRAAA